MSFSFDITLAQDSDVVRFHIGDTSEDGHYIEDETIDALVASEGSVGGAVIACIRFIISQLSSPDFKQDWLSVSNKEARAGYEKLLLMKSRELGISLGVTASASISLPYRADSDQDADDYVYDGSDA